MPKEVVMRGKRRGKGRPSAAAERARRTTGAGAHGGALRPGQRWSAERKREVVLRLVQGESLDALSRELGVELGRLEEWRDVISLSGAPRRSGEMEKVFQPSAKLRIRLEGSHSGLFRVGSSDS